MDERAVHSAGMYLGISALAYSMNGFRGVGFAVLTFALLSIWFD